MSTFRPAVPLLVEDAVMSKTVVESSPGVYAIKTVGDSVPAWTPQQAAQVTETVGPKANPPSSSIIGRLNSINSETTLLRTSFGSVAEVPADNTLQRRIKFIQDATGTQADADTTPTIIGLLKSIAAKL